MTETLCFLPSELLFLITEYLTHREYITLWLVHSRLYQVLTSLRYLQLRLKEDDPDITVAEHMRVLRHLAHHHYFHIRDNQAYPIDHRLVGIPACEYFTTDLYHRVWKKGVRVMYNDAPIRAREIGYLYEVNDHIVTDDGAIFDGISLHDAKVARIFKMCDGNIFYRDTSGRYILRFRDGISKVIESPYLHDVKEIHCSWFYTYNQAFESVTCPRIDHILHNNGEVYRALSGCLGAGELQLEKLSITYFNMNIFDLARQKLSKEDLLKHIPVSKMCYRTDEDGITLLCFDGTVIRWYGYKPSHYVTGEYYEDGTLIDGMLVNVDDICKYRGNIYYLVERRKVFYKSHDHIFRLIYTSPHPYRKIRIFDTNNRAVLCLSD